MEELIALLLQLYIVGAVINAIVKAVRRAAERPDRKSWRPVSPQGRRVAEGGRRRAQESMPWPEVSAPKRPVRQREHAPVKGMRKVEKRGAQEVREAPPLTVSPTRGMDDHVEKNKPFAGLPRGMVEPARSEEGETLEWHDIEPEALVRGRRAPDESVERGDSCGRELLELEGEGLLRGIIMAELLGPPRCKRKRKVTVPR